MNRNRSVQRNRKTCGQMRPQVFQFRNERTFTRWILWTESLNILIDNQSSATCFKNRGRVRRRGRVRLGGKNENPDRLSPIGVHKLWQCPTLAQPIDALPSGLQRFTSVFGMG